MTLVTTVDCHLCDDARMVVEQVLAAFPQVVLTERSLLDDRALREEFAEDVPVVIVDGRVHSTWFVDADRLRRRLDRAATAHP
ncbi:glutaredoxin family protein [Curtobacterium flaccumfaciens]|uniref:glutaredoxin family protein n=1 Tax=Curtobacterium flaccumfaciens TaxID=2035 RepID=UPI00224AB690|nr:glutaredoxin family protein [Curtobacterium flaccumfaciens]MCX2797937.1 glutaredoxin family protein [Curtobacterium flaccumfaciens pv. flaccumfaciens]